MAKIATDQDIAGMIAGIVKRAPTTDEPRYRMFLETIAEAIGAYSAVEVGTVNAPRDEPPQWYVAFHATIDTPTEGGGFATIDPDETIDDWLAEAQADDQIVGSVAPSAAETSAAVSPI